MIIERIRNSNNRYKRYCPFKLKYRNSNWYLEAFRRLQNFQTQAIALDLTRYLNEMDPTKLYDTDLWPGVTTLIISEMAKRSWTMFKLYLSKVALELGRSSNFDTLEIQAPTSVDDEVGDLKSPYLANRD